jgi:hypothetical protein
MMSGFRHLILASFLAYLSGVNATAADILDIKRNDAPQPACVPYTPFVYAHCFSDPSNPSALPYRATQLSNQNMTIDICVDFCKGKVVPPCEAL